MAALMISGVSLCVGIKISMARFDRAMLGLTVTGILVSGAIPRSDRGTGSRHTVSGCDFTSKEKLKLVGPVPWIDYPGLVRTWSGGAHWNRDHNLPQRHHPQGNPARV